MSRDIIIIGASGFGKQVSDIVLQSGNSIFGFLDDAATEKNFLGFPILGTTNDYSRFLEKEFIVAIGNAETRERIAQNMVGATWHTAVHPSSVIALLDTHIGEGCIIGANAVVGPGANVGKHCIINTGAIVGHDNKIGDYSHISAGAKIAGTVTVGSKTWIGVGASVRNNISICADCMIGIGAVVVSNIEKAGTYVGVPARKIK